MQEQPFQIVSSITSNAMFSWRSIYQAAIHLLWYTESTHLSWEIFQNIPSVFYSPSNVKCILEGTGFFFSLSLPVAALAWPYWNNNHHSKALWIISLGHLILSGSKLLSSSHSAAAKSQWTVCSSAKLNRLKLMQILLLKGKRLDVSGYRGCTEAKFRTGGGQSN